MVRKKRPNEIIESLHQEQQHLVARLAHRGMSQSGLYEEENQRLFKATLRELIEAGASNRTPSLLANELQNFDSRMVRMGMRESGIHEAGIMAYQRVFDNVCADYPEVFKPERAGGKVGKDAGSEGENRSIRNSTIKRLIIVASIFMVHPTNAYLVS